MSTFTDTAGRTWLIEITIDAIRRVRGLLGADLLRLLEGEPPLLTRLQIDIELRLDVTFALLKPEADARGIDSEDFARAMGGQAIADAEDAFWRALVSFFQSLRRPETLQAIEKQQKMHAAALAAAAAKLEAIDIHHVARKIESLDLDLDHPQTPGKTSIASPA